MSASPDENNLKYGWLTKAKVKEERARAQEKFEEDKAVKEKHRKGAPWPKEAWQAAAEAIKSGVERPELRFPIIITDSTGCRLGAFLRARY